MKLAIKGHPKRGKEVIEILEMLGGKNEFEDISFIKPNIFLFIGDDYYTEIEWDYIGDDINDEKIDVYYNKDNKDYVLIYGMNMTTGNEGWYQYDIKENTFQRYVENNLKEIEEDKELYFLLLCIAGGVCALSLLLMLVLGINNSKMKKKNKKMLVMLEELNNRVKGKDVTNDETKEEKEESLVKEEIEEVPEVKKTRNKKVKKEN